MLLLYREDQCSGLLQGGLCGCQIHNGQVPDIQSSLDHVEIFLQVLFFVSGRSQLFLKNDEIIDVELGCLGCLPFLPGYVKVDSGSLSTGSIHLRPTVMSGITS